MIEARRPEIISFGKRAKEAKIIDIVIPGGAGRNRNFVEGEVKVVPVVIEALGAVMFEKLNVAIRLEVIEKAALLGTAGLLRKVFAV